MDTLAESIDWLIRAYWIWMVISGLFGGLVGAGAMYGFLRKYLLPKEISEVHNRLQNVEEQLTNLKKIDPGYEVISWWDPPISLFSNILGSYNNYPRDILIKKTGKIKELPDRRKNK